MEGVPPGLSLAFCAEPWAELGTEIFWNALMHVPTMGILAFLSWETPEGAKSHMSRIASTQAVWLNMPICVAKCGLRFCQFVSTKTRREVDTSNKRCVQLLNTVSA